MNKIYYRYVIRPDDSVEQHLIFNNQNYATVYDNGVWHTWDDGGIGGENSREDSINSSKLEALMSVLNQGFIQLKSNP